MKKKDKIILILISTVIGLLSIFIIVNVIKILKYVGGNPKYIDYTNKTNGDIKYNVFLKPNDYIPEKSINTDFSYITDLVEYIRTNFNYQYYTDCGLDLNYKYSILANMIIESNEDKNTLNSKPIFNREFILLDEKKDKIYDSKITIVENLNIGLEYYNLILSNFVNDLKISTTAKLEIKLIVNIYDDSGYINKNQNITMSLPLGVKVFDISVTKNFVAEEIIYKIDQPTPQTSYVIAIIYIIVFIIINIFGVKFVKFSLLKNKEHYYTEKEKILKQFNDRIITVLNFINYEKWDVVDVLEFNELIEYANEAFEPIIYWEKKLGKNKESWFVILRNKIMYRYIIYSNKNKIK